MLNQNKSWSLQFTAIYLHVLRDSAEPEQTPAVGNRLHVLRDDVKLNKLMLTA